MARSDDINSLPEDLPAPIDDGACDHLRGMAIPALALRATSGATVDLSTVPGRMVVYIYPRTGRPDVSGVRPSRRTASLAVVARAWAPVARAREARASTSERW